MLKLAKYYQSGIIQDLQIALGVTLAWIVLRGDIASNEDPISLNGSFLIVISLSLIIGSVVFYFIFTKLSNKGIRALYGIILFIPFVLLIYEITVLMDRNISSVGVLTPQILLLIFIIALLLSFGIYFSYIYGKGIPRISVRNLGIIISSIGVGRIMAVVFDLSGIVIFAVFLSLFDIYSVFRGPLSKIMGRPQRIEGQLELPPRHVMDRQFNKICDEGTPVLLSYQNTLLGIGDVLFFSILMYYSLISWGFVGFGLTVFLIIVGSSGTLFLLRKISPLPGLPLPVFCSLLGYGVLYGLFGI